MSGDIVARRRTIENLAQRVSRLETELAIQQQQVQTLLERGVHPDFDRRIAEQGEMLDALRLRFVEHELRRQARSDDRQRPTAWPAGLSPVYGLFLDALRAIDPDARPPEAYRAMAGRKRVAWLYQRQVLYLISQGGLSSQQEIDYLVSLADDLKPGSIDRRLIGRLTKASVLITHITNLSLTRNMKIPIALLRLTNDGRECVRALELEPVENEWERIIRLHQGERYVEHAAAMIMVAVQARQRGWHVTVLPDLKGVSRAEPDLLLQRGDQQVYVEVELSDKEYIPKWRALVELQGYVALVARNADYRRRLVGDGKAKGWPVKATDLETLNRLPFEQRDPRATLWAEEG